jgi:two-component system chemotaxis response regulator CheB
MIRVLVVDDSAIVRQTLTDALSKYDDIEVVGSAVDPYVARDKIVALKPDVITLDIEMPRMDGLSFLAKLMKHHPMPVVVVSSITTKSAETAAKALELGAVEVVNKPGSARSTPEVARRLVHAIRAASVARIGVSRTSVSPAEPANKPVSLPPGIRTGCEMVALGASTGGTTAIETVLRGLPSNAPGIVIVQHMPEHFTQAFANRLNQVCEITVREARDGDMVTDGTAYIAPGGRHTIVQQGASGRFLRLKDGPQVFYQKPAVDVMFQSVARIGGKGIIGVLLTGMGADGANGLLQLRQSGAYTIAQDEASCVVFGMPREAIRLGGVDVVLPLSQVSQAILNQAMGAKKAA